MTFKLFCLLTAFLRLSCNLNLRLWFEEITDTTHKIHVFNICINLPLFILTIHDKNNHPYILLFFICHFDFFSIGGHSSIYGDC